MYRTSLAASVALLTLSHSVLPISAGAETSWQEQSFRMPSWSQSSLERLQSAINQVTQHSQIRKLTRSGLHALSLSGRIGDREIETTKFQAHYKGLEVIGSMALHHAVSRRGNTESTLSNMMSVFDLDVDSAIPAEDAVSIARSIASGLPLAKKPVLKILPEMGSGSAKLVYWTELSPSGDEPGRDLIINAQDGSVIADISHHLTIAPVTVYATNSKCQTVDGDSGMPTSLAVKKCDLAHQKGTQYRVDSSAQTAASNASKTVNYFWSKHGRDSYDGAGSELVSVVHVGEKFANAFWSSDMKVIGYGDGDGEKYGDFTKALDVAGHELTHGVTSETAGLLYFGESGALNEAYSDFFGKMISQDGDWTIGKGIFLENNTRGIRNLANPSALTFSYADANGKKATRPYPKHVREKMVATGTCSKKNDNCWVHINSLIPGHASYLMTQAIGTAKTERLYYLVLTQYLTPTSTFQQHTEQTLKACAALYDSATCAKVKTTLASVGL